MLTQNTTAATMTGRARALAINSVKSVCVLTLLAVISTSTSYAQSHLEELTTINQLGDGYVDITQCFTTLISDVEVPAQESGPLILVSVTEGHFVETGLELARIDDQLAQLQMETAQTKLAAAQEKASSDIDIQAADNALEIAERERQTNLGLYEKGALAKYDYDRSALAAKQAALQLEQARRNKEAALKDAQVETHNVRAATSSIARHLIKSPISGNVLELYKEAGEWVNAGDNVMRVARFDRVYVQGLLDSRLFNPHEVEGQSVTVTLTMARGEQVQFEGQIVYVGLEKNSSSYYSIRAEVQNKAAAGRWLLLSGEEVTMRIHLNQNQIGRNNNRQHR